ncbi:MAG: histidine ammonia-lyase [Chloroflexi bacterium]|nr:histidine ammonia-lyase [Chloroflexota bacterium]
MRMEHIEIDGQHLSLEQVGKVAREKAMVDLAPAAQEKIQDSHRALQALLDRGDPIYGITTGFGNFADRPISPQQQKTLQRNLILSHATGVGEPLSEEVVRGMILIRANALAKGYSGVRPEVVQALLDLLNREVTPYVPSRGSLGASGDLAPLAHMGLVLIGEGEAYFQGALLSGNGALTKAGLAPLTLEAKEGIAITNGTSLMAALGALEVFDSQNLVQVADLAGALTLEALAGTPEAFHPYLQALRPIPGQIESAAFVLRLLEGSQAVRNKDRKRVQDAYSLRCIPQVHGAVREALAHAQEIVEIELNSASDNPLVFWDGGNPMALSGGNFHGEPLALALDYLTIAITELGNISERRLNRLLDPALNEGLLPAFLIKEGGLNSGFMLAQYTAASLCAENKVLAHPASVDNIPTSAGTEDHASMGATAALKAREVVNNLATIIAIELMAAAQAIDFRREAEPGLMLGKGTEPAYRDLREIIPFIEKDTILYPYIGKTKELVASGQLLARVKSTLGG